MDQPRRKFGAPPKREAEPGERFQLGIRVTAELKGKLDAAAEQSGRSQSQEAELRLEHTFDRQGLLSEVLTLAYGKRAADDLMLLGATMTMDPKEYREDPDRFDRFEFRRDLFKKIRNLDPRELQNLILRVESSIGFMRIVNKGKRK